MMESPTLHKSQIVCVFLTFINKVYSQAVIKTGNCYMIPEGHISSVTQSHPTLCDPINCSTPGFPVHQLLELKGGQILPSSQVIYSM